MTSGPVLPMVWEGDSSILTGRKINGATKPSDHEMGSFRADHSIGLPFNTVHGSDGPESAQREINHWFKPDELVGWVDHSNNWVYEKTA